MSIVTKVTAYSNGEIAYLSWTIKKMIPNCLGFEITRIYPDTPDDNTVLPAWVAFKGQSNKKWLPQNTSVWPIQKLSWLDFTLRKRRNKIARRQGDVRVQYLVRPVVPYDETLEEVKPTLKKTYEGTPVKLSYYDEGTYSGIVGTGLQHGSVRATFTNGILATQWLAHVIKGKSFPGVKKAIKDQNNQVRKYLAGDALPTLLLLLAKAKNNANASVKMALYELDDDELVDNILAIKDRVEIVLSNTSKNKQGKWDAENSANRSTLKKAGIPVTDRMFNNTHIGHNKFVVYLEKDKPLSVLTGSTNWTSNGLCAQSNNAAIIDSPEIAQLYDDYFEELKKDTDNFTTPKPLSKQTSNVQGAEFRSLNEKGNKMIKLGDGTKITIWFSPNTKGVSVNKKQIPPDLSSVYSIMRKAEKAIFFAVFLPGRANDWRQSDIMTNIITESISLGEKDKSLLVYGSISDPTAMPNYVASKNGSKTPTPFTYEDGNLHVVRAANISDKNGDLIGDFQNELLSAGHAIIHDKIVVIDPFSENGAVVFGSHNLGFKASYGNDENLVIIQNNPSLVQAYALHVLDIFEHYRFRAVQAELETKKQQKWDGFLSADDEWLKKALVNGDHNSLAEYMTNG
jgi:phosphatidylserine/phosphatidylglycerophosphate/cardiolipin synthase-like enzyme